MTMIFSRRQILLICAPCNTSLFLNFHSRAAELNEGPGMTLAYGSVIDKRRISIKYARLPDGSNFSTPGSLGGRFTKGENWLNDGISATLAASWDHRNLPEWVDFEWQELEYPGLKPEKFPTYFAFREAVKKRIAASPIKRQRLFINSRVPDNIKNSVIESKSSPPAGTTTSKGLWLYIFWTPDGIKFRWIMRDKNLAPTTPFGGIVQEGGDNLDAYNN